MLTNPEQAPSAPSPAEHTPLSGPDCMAQIAQLYQNYLELTAQLKENEKPLESFLSLSSSPANHPCHKQFARDLEAALIPAAQLTADEVYTILEYMYQAPLDCGENSLAYWMLLAVHGSTLPLIARLTEDQSAKLWAYYKEAYPRRKRMPVQETVLKALKSR